MATQPSPETDLELMSDQIAFLQAELSASQAREAAARQAQEEFQARFVSRLIHDLKNPLTTIVGRVEMLKRVSQRETIQQADVHRHLSPLEAATQRLQEVLLKASQLDDSDIETP
jgi:Osmosensitive K+ channel histidine kinase